MPTRACFERRPDFQPVTNPAELFRANQDAVDRVRVRFSARVSRWVRERYPDCKPQPDGSVIVTFQASSMDWLVQRVLEYGPDAELVGPEEYREAVRRAWRERRNSMTALGQDGMAPGRAKWKGRGQRSSRPLARRNGPRKPPATARGVYARPVRKSRSQGAGAGIRTLTGVRPSRCEGLCVYQFRHTRYRGTPTRPVAATPCPQRIVPLAATTCSGERETW